MLGSCFRTLAVILFHVLVTEMFFRCRTMGSLWEVVVSVNCQCCLTVVSVNCQCCLTVVSANCSVV